MTKPIELILVQTKDDTPGLCADVGCKLPVQTQHVCIYVSKNMKKMNKNKTTHVIQIRWKCVCTSSISVAEVGKPPNVTQTHSIAHAGEHKLNLVAPVPSSGVFILLHRLTWNGSILRKKMGKTKHFLLSPQL